MNREVRVVRLFSRLNVGGPAIHVILLTAGLVARGYRTRLVVGTEASREGSLTDRAAQHGIALDHVPALGREIRPLRDLLSLFLVWRLIRRFRPHVVHTHTAKAGVLGRLAARAAGVPVVVHTFHGHVLKGYFGPLKTAFFRRVERLLARSTDVVVAVSDSVKRDLVEMGIAPEARVRVIPLGLEVAALAGPLPSGALVREAGGTPGLRVGIVGRLVPIKDVGTFLRAAAIVRKSLPACRFSVVGDGPERFLLETEAGRLGIREAVHFHGWHAEVGPVYGDLDLVVNCSRNEGTPVALIEALAAGRRVVATDVGGNRDLLGGGAHGVLVPPGNAEALAEAIVEALGAGAEGALARARAGQRYVLERHTPERLLDDIDALYRELLARRQVARAATSWT